MDDSYIQKNIMKMETELRDLKTIQGAIKKAPGFAGTYTHHDSTQQGKLNQIIEVTYADNNGPILSSVYGNPFAVMLQPIGNKQKIYFTMIYDNSSIVVNSNKEILSIVRIT